MRFYSYIIIIVNRGNNMTVQELVIKLEECRNYMEGSDDELAQSTFDTLNEVIHTLENDGIDGNEYYSSGRNKGRY